MEELNKLFVEMNFLKEKHKKEDLFNGFMSFGIGADETKHSRFIGMLLNPKGAHKQGEKFLKLFLEHIVSIKEFKLKRIRVECEKSTFNNRRIDIAIENEDKIIIIENKFWAIDQPRQLIDYFSYGKAIKNSSQHVFMIYLTPYGKPPTIESLGGLDIKSVICVSYEKQITDWLDSCIDSLNSSGASSLKISLEMYVELIRKVINRDKYMTEIMNNLISSPKNMEFAIDIVKAFQGKSFLNDIDTRKIIINRIEDIARKKYELDFPEGDDETELWYVLGLKQNEIIMGYLCFTDTHIYGKKMNGDEIADNQIIGNDINCQDLINVLTNNTSGIENWLTTITQLF